MAEPHGNPGEKPRARYVGMGTAENDNSPVWQITRVELMAIIRQAVNEALEAGGGVARLVDKPGLARQLCCSIAHIDVLRKRGLPTVLVGQSVRFEPERVIEWLREQPVACNDLE